MRNFSNVAVCALLVSMAMATAGCGQVNGLKAKMAFREANGLYQSQDYRAALEAYEESIELDPSLTDAYFYLANSADNLYRAVRRGEPENDALLTTAVENYEKASEFATQPNIKQLALEYLVSAYTSPDKLNDPGMAEPLVLRMIEMDPTEMENYFALARIYEDFGDYERAEEMLVRAQEVQPDQPRVYMILAGYYNRQGEFEKTIEALQQRATIEPNNPEVYYTIATYYWDKAYRDFRIQDADKRELVQTGLDMIDKAISIKDDYDEALVYKNLLLRTQANLETDRSKQLALLKEADELRDRAEALRKMKLTDSASAAGE
jgi:tetratricopeptide (TPR) repeat protein